MIKEGLLVGVGAALGALARYGLLFAFVPLGFPGFFSSEVVLTLAINVLGAFIIGLIPPSPFWTTGFLGGFTTFSAFALAAAQSSLMETVLLIVATFVLTVGAYLLADRLTARRSAWKH